VPDVPILLSPPDVGLLEREYLLAAFDSNWIAPVGPDLDAFEQDMAARLGVGHAVGLSSGTAALHLALMGVGVTPGSVVIVPTLTFAATVNAVRYIGAEPLLVDSSADTWTLDPAIVALAITDCLAAGRRVSAVLAVDLYGQCADYAPLLALCERHGIPLVEDAAEGLGGTYDGRPAGSFGAAAALSFNGNKIITTGGGGMLLTDDGELARRARYLATQAREPVLHYEHREVGYNYRLGNLAAALGRAQLQTLDDKVKARRETDRAYREQLGSAPGLTPMPQAEYGESSCWLSCWLVDPRAFGATRNDLIEHLASAGIESRPTWKPMHQQPVFDDLRVLGGPVADEVFALGLCLPSGSALTPEDRDRVAAAVLGTPRSR
jgi:dTDP-4-amino-4,6-dideoxygalactose transaminase